MKAPAFWQGQGLLPHLLQPVGWALAGAAALRRAFTHPVKVERPVICIGNLTVGGTGKTPTALAVAQLLAEERVKPWMLTRGYRGRLVGPVRVDPLRHDAEAVGDEALLLAQAFPTIVSRDRVHGAEAAVRGGAEAIVMDDGFQNPGLAKDLSLLVIDGGAGFGNGRLLPAGPLREMPATGIRRAQAAVLIGADRTGALHALGRLPVLTGQLVPAAEDVASFRGRRAVAFAGIGRPEKFFETLEGIGVELVERHAFADHEPYSQFTLAKLDAAAGRRGAVLLTTAKDAVRLPPLLRSRVGVVRVRLRLDDPAALRQMLAPLFR